MRTIDAHATIDNVATLAQIVSNPLDPATFAAVAITFAAIATVALHVPARRAASVDPLIAVRCE